MCNPISELYVKIGTCMKSDEFICENLNLYVKSDEAIWTCMKIWSGLNLIPSVPGVPVVFKSDYMRISSGEDVQVVEMSRCRSSKMAITCYSEDV